MVITGVIRPPPEIRAVADRTASYVAKNGRAFEARILKSEKGKSPKFAFLQPTSPFHAYYEERIKFYESGGDDAEEKKSEIERAMKKKESAQEEAKPPKDIVRKKEKTQKASAINPIAKALLAQRSKISEAKAKKKESETPEGKDNISTLTLPPPPPLDLVAIVAPSTLSAAQIETIQLVAQFTAMDGKGGPFLHQLTLREWTNSDFAFCQPRHAHFAYFSALVDAYRKIIDVWTASVSSKLDDPNIVADPHSAMEEAAYRAEYERELEQQKSQQEDGEVAAIDWHDFVVVETIDFPVDEVVELSMLPPPPPPPRSQAEKTDEPAKQGEDAMDESDEEEEETIRVVPSYTPKVVAPTNLQQARAIDPITGKSVSVADMPEHMRIQLLDPKWAEERKKFQEKQKDSNLVGGDAIVSNISRFAQARGDLFGKSERDLLKKEKESKLKLEEANRIIREQANQQNTGQQYPATPATVGPSPPVPPKSQPSNEPPLKRMRVDGIPPPPPPPPSQMVGTTVITGQANDPEMQVSGEPMTDAMLQTHIVEGETPVKKLLPDVEFAASLSKPEVTLQIRIPNDPSQMAWNFYGQILSMTVNVMSTVKQVKAELSKMHLNGMPANKIQFKDPKTGFLKDGKSLASLNIGPTATLEMVPKTRGGRK